MNRVNVKEQILNLVLLLLLQLPLVYRAVLFDEAFAFFYVGFLLLLPWGTSRINLMLIGFGSGLLVDVFCNTPGLHAAASVFILFIRNYWLGIVYDDSDEITNLNVASLKKLGFIYYIFPLVFIHHLTIFLIENGGFHLIGTILRRSFLSALLSSSIIFTVNFIITPNSRRA